LRLTRVVYASSRSAFLGRVVVLVLTVVAFLAHSVGAYFGALPLRAAASADDLHFGVGATSGAYWASLVFVVGGLLLNADVGNFCNASPGTAFNVIPCGLVKLCRTHYSGRVCARHGILMSVICSTKQRGMPLLRTRRRLRRVSRAPGVTGLRARGRRLAVGRVQRSM